MSWAVWITGRPGSGKSTLARQVAEVLRKRGETVVVLDATELSSALVPGRGPSPREQDLVHRALVHTASTLIQSGIPVIIDATAHRRAWRDLARETIHTFAEVQLVCRDEVCGAREQATRWNRMATGSVGRAPAEPEVVLDYEYSLRADLTVDTEAQHVWTAVEEVLLLVERLRRSAQSRAGIGDQPS